MWLIGYLRVDSLISHYLFDFTSGDPFMNTSQTPSEPSPNLPLSQTFPKDLVSGLVVALVALPLCLGIAIASGQEPISGLMAGIVGGIIISWISGSKTSVSGPAAGLTAVVIAQVDSLGSFEAFLTAVIIAGVLQVILGLARAGSLARYFPASVIKGLLAAIGVILILKQIPALFGYDVKTKLSFELLPQLFQGNMAALLIGFISVALLLIWPRTRLKNLLLPAPLFVVVLAVGLSAFLSGLGNSWVVGSDYLVNVPVTGSIGELFGELSRPNFDVLSGQGVWIAVVTICIVASLETLLNLDAVDKLDPKGRHSPPNRELLA
jgi:carbonic anhydrase/SulP family sulfate permease